MRTFRFVVVNLSISASVIYNLILFIFLKLKRYGYGKTGRADGGQTAESILLLKLMMETSGQVALEEFQFMMVQTGHITIQKTNYRLIISGQCTKTAREIYGCQVQLIQ